MKIDLELDELLILDNLVEEAINKYTYNKNNEEYTNLENLSYKLSQIIDKIET